MSILTDELSVINAGLPLIVEGVPAAQVTQLDWRPPAFGDADVARLALTLVGPPGDRTWPGAVASVTTPQASLTPSLTSSLTASTVRQRWGGGDVGDVRPGQEVMSGTSGPAVRAASDPFHRPTE